MSVTVLRSGEEACAPDGAYDTRPEQQTIVRSSNSAAVALEDKAGCVVDMSKPLVFQVGHLGSYYQQWVHIPEARKGPARFFKSDIMETISRTPWFLVPLVWMPVVFACLAYPLVHWQLRRDVAVVAFLAGMVVWSLLEYLIHRFIFHHGTQNYWGNTFHFLFHGCHHKLPLDNYRLVFPPTAAAVVASLGFLLALSLAPSLREALPLFAGGLCGYVLYDCMHYYVHHGQMWTAYLKRMKTYHLAHHFKHPEHSYGITSTMWDRVFQTGPQVPKRV
eukprot:jgi/Chlat1/5975/Chrsp4S06293